MKDLGHLEKWASGILGAVCLLLALNLVFRTGVRAGASRPTMAPSTSTQSRRVDRMPLKGDDDLARYDPVLKLDLLKELLDRPLPRLERNPFEFPAARVAPAPTPAAPAPAAPPPPPPMPLKAMGYSEKAGGVREAYVSDEEQVYVVHEGDVVANKYRITKITPTAVEVVDETSSRTVQLTIPQ